MISTPSKCQNSKWPPHPMYENINLVIETYVIDYFGDHVLNYKLYKRTYSLKGITCSIMTKFKMVTISKTFEKSPLLRNLCYGLFFLNACMTYFIGIHTAYNGLYPL